VVRNDRKGSTIGLNDISNLFAFEVDIREILNSITAPFLIIDRNRNALFANQSFEVLTGFPVGFCKGIPCHHIARCEICMKNCPIDATHNNFEPVSVNTNFLNRDRKIVNIQIVINPIKNKKGEIKAYVESYKTLGLKTTDHAGIEMPYSFKGIIGRSHRMEKIFQILPVLAQSDASILITGETGTGKDKVAEAIHHASSRKHGPFIKVNCGALPDTLLESELFGHTKGAFTGAVENKPGRFKLAHNGTLYLTEIGDLPFLLQVKLLTVLDDGIIFPLGSTKGFKTDVRFIAATHRNLEEMVAKGEFRQDLFYRLSVARLHLPALCERHGDIRLLLDHFCRIYSSRAGKSIKGFRKKVLDLLNKYQYPGNVRELANIVEYSVAICNEDYLRIDHLPSYLTDTLTIDTARQKSATQEKLIIPACKPSFGEKENFSWKHIEKQMIMDALIKTNGNKGKAASYLGWGRSTLWRKMKQFKIN